MTANENGLDKGLAVWGDRTEIRDIAGRCEKMIPGIIKLPAHLQSTAALAMAQISVMAGLNPFIGELWPIPQKSSRGGQVDGFQIMVGVKGLRRVAKVQAKDLGLVPPYYRPTWRWPNEDEKEAMALKAGDVAVICELELFLPPGHPYFSQGDRRYTVEGIGLVRTNYYGKMEPIQAARKRAESDALKMAFDIPLGGTVVDIDYEATDWIEVKPQADIPEMVNRVDPESWDSLMAMLVADGSINTPMDIHTALVDLKVTYLDDENFYDIVKRAVDHIEAKRSETDRDQSLPVEPKERGRDKLYKEEDKAPLPRGPFPDRDPGANAAMDAVLGAPGRVKARKAVRDAGTQPAEETPERALGGLTVEGRAAIIGPQPWDPPKVLAYLQDAAKGMRDQTSPISEKQKGLLSRKGRELFAGQTEADLKYHSFLLFAFGVSSTGHLKKCQAGALLDLILDGDRGPDGDYQLSKHAPEEAAQILRAKMEEAGQANMFKEAQEEAQEKGEHDDVLV